MSENHSATPFTDPSQALPPKTPPSSASRIRLLVLLGLLGLMLGALWYDYKVARPAVENAYNRIAQLNNEINSRSGKQYMTNKDVQNELKRDPFETFTEGGYFVEVYGWRSGLPTKRHKYYAVYTEGSPYIFLKHYMTNIEMDELRESSLQVKPPDSRAADLPLTESAIPFPRPPTDSNASEKKNPAASSSEPSPAIEKPAAEQAQIKS